MGHFLNWKKSVHYTSDKALYEAKAKGQNKVIGFVA